MDGELQTPCSHLKQATLEFSFVFVLVVGAIPDNIPGVMWCLG